MDTPIKQIQLFKTLKTLKIKIRKEYHQNFYKSIPRHLSRFQRMKMVNEYEREKRLQYCSINAFSLISTKICVNAVNIKADLKAYEVKHPPVIKLAISTTFFVSGKRRHFEENLRRLDRRSDIAWQEHFLPKCYQNTIKALMNATNQLKENMDYCSRWFVRSRKENVTQKTKAQNQVRVYGFRPV